MPAIPQSVNGLKSGTVSVVLHVPFEAADKAFKIHPLCGESVRLAIYLDDA